MSYQLFFLTDTNPNLATGGGGCICSPEQQLECLPPYLVFPGNEMESIASPHVVACLACLDAGVAACHGEILQAGEDGPKAASSRFKAKPRPSIDAESFEDEDVPEI